MPNQLRSLRRYLQLFRELSTDYLGVKGAIDEMRESRERVGLHIPVVDYPKPYTILASYLFNRLNVPYEVRVAGCTAVELLIKPLMAVDDFVDRNWRSLVKQMEWSESLTFKGTESDKINFEYLRLNPLFNAITGLMVLAEHEKTGLAKQGSADIIKEKLSEKGEKVLDSYAWQIRNRIQTRDDILNGTNFPSVEEVFDKYVRGIAGEPFSLVPEIASCYISDSSIRSSISLMYPFGDVFQCQDDRMDIHEDIVRLQITSATAAILNHGMGDERELLYKLVKMKVTPDSRSVHKKFHSLQALEDRMNQSRHLLRDGLINLGLNVVVEDLDLFDKNYEEIRSLVSKVVIR